MITPHPSLFIKTTGRRGKDGIALIIVLGFLSILIIMAVTLMTMTRTERLVSDSTLESNRCRQLARSAIISAINDLSTELFANQLIIPPKALAVYQSTAKGGTVEALGKLGLLDGEASYWVPRKYYSTTDSDLNAPAISSNNAQWVFVTDSQSPNSILGRYGYVVLDCSGMLDANTVSFPNAGGDFNPTSSRLNGRDVNIALLPEVINRDFFVDNRANYYGFDTFQELLAFNDGIPSLDNYWRNPDRAALNTDLLTNLQPYGQQYYRGYFDWNSKTWHEYGMPGISDNINDWTIDMAVEAFKQLLGAPQTEAEMLANNLFDFMDTNRIPRSLEQFTTEAVPMFNELIFKGRVTASGDGLSSTLRVTLNIETWYPFPGKTAEGGYRVAASGPSLGVANALGVGNISFQVGGPGGALNIGEIQPDDNPEILIDDTACNPKITTYTYPNINMPYTNGATAIIRIRVNNLLMVQGGALIDQIPQLDGLPNVTFAIPNAGVGTDFDIASMGVTDPRMNYLKDSWSQSGNKAGSPDAINPQATSAGALEEGYWMYVRDDRLETPADVGFLGRLGNWKSINLFEEGGRQIVARFLTDTNKLAFLNSPKGYEYGYWTNGYINPGTSCGDVLRCIFTRAEIAEVPTMSEPWDDTTPDGGIDRLVGAMTNGSVAGRQGPNSFDSPAAWGTIKVMQPKSPSNLEPLAAGPKGLNNNKRDALIRNTHQLFNPTENLSTVIVVAQTIKDDGVVGTWEPGIDVVTAERRAVALVWCDPFPNAQGIHEMFIRQFKYLDE